jgi:hypothetical protein
MTPKRHGEPNQLAKSIIDIATGQAPDRDPTHRARYLPRPGLMGKSRDMSLTE